jgi:glycosyltransferase involved in cell wall biosynthesis
MNAQNILSVIIPVLNEERTIKDSLNAVLEEGCVKEIIVINDGSTDSTAHIVKTIALKNSKVKLINLEKNYGKGYAVSKGIEQASGLLTIIQDADLEYNPIEYTKLINPILAGRADIVYGSRFLGSGEHRVLYFWHYLGNKFLTTLSNMFTNLNLTDMETCYKVAKTEVFKAINVQERGFGIEPEITAKFAKMRKPIYEVSISYYGRTYEEGKKIGWIDGFKAIYCILKYS